MQNAAAWDEILENFEDSSLEQCAHYARARWPRRDEAGPVVRDKHGNPVAMARVATARLPIIGGGVAYVKFGPVWRRRGDALEPARYREAIGAIVDLYVRRRGLLLTVHPRPHPEAQEIETQILKEFGFRQRRPSADRHRYIVKLIANESERRSALGTNWRRNLVKAEREGFRVAEESSVNAILSFQSLHAEMVARKNASQSDPIHLLARLVADLPSQLKPRIFLASLTGEVVAGAVVARHGDVAYYLYGATSDRGVAVRAGYFLQWHITGLLADEGAELYDLGGAVGSHGLERFKQGLLGKAAQPVEMAGEWDFWEGTVGRLRGDILHRVRRMTTRTPRQNTTRRA